LNKLPDFPGLTQSAPLNASQFARLFDDPRTEITVSVHEHLADIADIWVDFQRDAASTLYQSFQWCKAWNDTVALLKRCSARIVVGRNSACQVVFILPLQIRSSYGLKILECYGYPDTNYSYGLFQRRFLPTAAEWFEDNLTGILQQVGDYDALCIQDMPENMEGFPHPLRSLFNLTAPNLSYAMKLQPDFQHLYASKRSANTRKSIRKRDARLQAQGEVYFGLPQSGQDTKQVLQTMFEQKAERMAEDGVHNVFSPSSQNFVQLLAAERFDGTPLLLPFVLKIDGKVQAVMLGGQFNGAYWPFISSFGKGDIQKHSPGDFVLRNAIEACCGLGMTKLDFGIGESDYKKPWADEIITMKIALKAGTHKGLIWAIIMSSIITLKRIIKQTPLLKKLAFRLRRFLLSKQPAKA
jgi:CelD/BcsL family acetyltransferase involved in cellulose biosynthesis